MPDTLAIEWASDQLVAVWGSVSGTQLRIRKACLWPRSPEQEETPAKAGAWLAERIKEAGIKADKVLVALPRNDAVVKRIELPDVPDAELPDVVRFQAQSRTAQPISELALDFLPAPRREGLPREVLLATLGRPTLDRVRQICEAAGLVMGGISLTPATLAEIIARADSEVRPGCAVISRLGQRLEILLLKEGQIAFSHASRLAEDFSTHQQQQAILSELSRALVAARGQNVTLKVEQAWLLGEYTGTAALITAMEARFSCQAHELDLAKLVHDEAKVDWPIGGSSFSSPMGLLFAKSDPKAAPLDFLNPRQAPKKTDPRRQQATIAAAAATIFVFGGMGWYAWSYTDINARIDRLVAEEQHLNKLVKDGKPLVEEAAAVKKWQTAKPDWLSELTRFSQQLPPTDRLYLKSIKVEPATGKTRGRISAQMVARERIDATDFRQRLLSLNDIYSVQPQNPREGDGDTYYPWRYELSMSLNPLPDTDSKRKAAPSARAEKPAAAASTADKTQGSPKTTATTPGAQQKTPTAPATKTPATPVTKSATAASIDKPTEGAR